MNSIVVTLVANDAQRHTGIMICLFNVVCNTGCGLIAYAARQALDVINVVTLGLCVALIHSAGNSRRTPRDKKSVCIAVRYWDNCDLVMVDVTGRIFITVSFFSYDIIINTVS